MSRSCRNCMLSRRRRRNSPRPSMHATTALSPSLRAVRVIYVGFFTPHCSNALASARRFVGSMQPDNLAWEAPAGKGSSPVARKSLSRSLNECPSNRTTPSLITRRAGKDRGLADAIAGAAVLSRRQGWLKLTKREPSRPATWSRRYAAKFHLASLVDQRRSERPKLLSMSITTAR